MTKDKPSSLFAIPGVAEFHEHLQDLIKALEKIHKHRGSKNVSSLSAHGLIADKKYHIDAQAVADLVSEDLKKLLHPDLDFADWKLTVKSGAKNLRWARAGSRGRGGVDIPSSIPSMDFGRLFKWVAASLVVQDIFPHERDRLTNLNLTPGEETEFLITAGSYQATVKATSPTLAYLKACMLGMLPEYMSFTATLHCKYHDDMRTRFEEVFAKSKDLLSEFPHTNNIIKWSSFPELKSRLMAHSSVRSIYPKDALDVCSGQIELGMRDELAAFAITMADKSAARSTPDDYPRRWVITSHEEGAGRVYMAPDPARAMMVAAMDIIVKGPPPAPIETWDIYAVEDLPDESLDA